MKPQRNQMMLGDSLRRSDPLGVADDFLSPKTSDVSQEVHDENLRSNSRVRVNAKLRVRPCNSRRSRRGSTGVCRDLSPTGFGAIMRSAPQVGHVYWVMIENELSGEPVVARCMRCRFLADNSFEVGFAFFAAPHLDRDRAEVQFDLI